MLKKILVLGTNSELTDNITSDLAKKNNSTNQGLIDQQDFIPDIPGYYHTSIVDLSEGNIINASRHYDQIIMPDIPAEDWSHWKIFLSTYKLMCTLQENGVDTVFKNNKNVQNLSFFDNFMKTNKSFCIYPWIELLEDNGNCYPCIRSYSGMPVKKYKDLENWQTDPDYTELRNKMLNGERQEKLCQACYQYEDKGIESYRQFETKEWILKLNINTIEDLKKIDQPYLYEVRLQNICNLKCRSCHPGFSNLIGKEYKENNIEFDHDLFGRGQNNHRQTFEYSSTDIIDIKTLNEKVRVYLAGGEPTVTPEVFSFMEKCIDAGKTDFHLSIGTNGQHMTDRWFELCEHFSNMNFSISLDGYDKINDYWRSNSDWDTIVKNMYELRRRGHSISINTVPGIYNVTNLHLLYEWLDKEFPETTVYLQMNYFPAQSAFNHPRPQLVLDSMEKCMNTKMYHSDGKSNRSGIDGLYKHYSELPVCNLDDLRDFFEHNDKLDKIRNIKLKDYIPELEECRKLLK